MKILSIDTSSNICGVSLLEDTNLICKLDADTGRTHSENLMPMIDEALKKAELKPTDINLVVCDIGPGSFTGIRIGVATAKAFSDSLNIPCIGISSLEALAYKPMFLEMFLGTDLKCISKTFGNTINMSQNEIKYVCSLIDCKNDNCYFALYEKNDNGLETLIEPQAESVEGALAILNSYSCDTLDNAQIAFVGDGSEVYRAEIAQAFENAYFLPSEFNILSSDALALSGLCKFNSGIELDDALPLYLKKPQAQRQLEEKELNSKK